MSLLRRALVPGLILALLLTAAVTMFDGEQRRTLVADFPRTVAVYEGSDVRVLGVSVGTVDAVEPHGTGVKVTMSYDAGVKVPADAKAAVVAPSVVGDRFVQLAPVYRGGPVMPDGAELGQRRTATPLELDEVFGSIDDLTVALGPRGANRNGALSDLLDSSAANLDGQGAKLNRTIEDVGTLTGTLANNKDELFDTARRLERFINTLAENDRTVRRFNGSLAGVSDLLADERRTLVRSLRALAVAMRQVRGFVRDNRELLGENIRGLDNVAGVLVKQREALDQVLGTAPGALNNLMLTYNPQTGTLDTRANLGDMLDMLRRDPATYLCNLVNNERLCKTFQGLIPEDGGGLFRSGALGQGTGSPHGRPVEPSDPTLGGLVEADQ